MNATTSSPIIVTIETASLGDRSYLVHDGTVAFVVDPQRDIDRVLDLLEEHGVQLTDVFETHIHNDYVTGGLALAERTGAASVPVLARCADQQRELARRRSEEQIRRLPVRLLGPLVLCILPALMVATFGPLALVSLGQLGAAVP